ncbi:hypothetical protein FGG78_38855, partial [Thioclava sp. BHET1]
MKASAALYRRRTIALGVSLALALGAGVLFLQFGAADGLDSMDVIRSVLIFCSTFWLAWGAVQGLWGLLWRYREPPPMQARRWSRRSA